MLDLSAEAAARVAAEVGGAPAQADVSDAGSVKEAFGALRAALGPLDVLVNCAGVWYEAPFLDLPLDKGRREADVNLWGVVHCCREAAPDMIAKGSGRIVSVASDAGRIGEKNQERSIPGFIVPSPFFDVKLGDDGLIRVTNPGRHQIETYTTAGEFVSAWGQASAALEGFCGCCNPIHLVLLPNGRTVTCEKGLPRVKVYGPGGAFECVVAGT